MSYDIARAAAQARNCDFHAVAGSEHGFDIRDREDEAIAVMVVWTWLAVMLARRSMRWEPRT